MRCTAQLSEASELSVDAARVLTAKMRSRLTVALKVPCVSSGRLRLGEHIQSRRSSDLELRENDLRRHAENDSSINSWARARSGGGRQHSISVHSATNYRRILRSPRRRWRMARRSVRAVTKLSNTWLDARPPQVDEGGYLQSVANILISVTRHARRLISCA
jgi:hypothetical protein